MTDVWVYVSDDEYELPLAVADSKQELAVMIGKTVNNISAAMIHAEKRGNNCRYKRIEIDESDWED